MPIKQAVSSRKRRIRGTSGRRRVKISVFYRMRMKQIQKGVVIGLKGKARMLAVKRRRTLLGRRNK